MNRSAALSALALAFALSACGSKPGEPVEQVVVGQPGGDAGPSAAAAGAPAADALAAGKAAFAVCSSCHSVTPGAPAGLGPNLAGVVGRKAGSAPGYVYSAALKASGITWTEAELDAFIAAPAKRVPGTRMSAAPIGDAARRAAIVAYLAASPG